MKPAHLNLGVDFAAAVLFLGMLATGFILRFPLPPGTQRSHMLWGLSRHDWGAVHTWLSFGLIIVLLVHVILHWPWIFGILRNRFGSGSRTGSLDKNAQRRAGILTLAVLAAILTAFAWATYAGVRTIEEPREPLREREQRHGGDFDF